MNVLIFSQIFPPDLGGSATRAYNVAKGLLAHNVNVTVIAGFPHYPTGNVPRHLRKKALAIEYFDGMKVIRTYMPPIPAKGFINRIILFTSFMLSSLFPFFLVRRIDCIFVANPQILSIYPALIYKFFHRCPVVLNVDDLWPEDIEPEITRSSLIRRLGEVLAKIAYVIADAITPISPGYTKVINGKYGIPESKIHVVRGGVDTSKFKPMPSKNDEKFTVLYSGAFSVAYDFDQVLKAAKILEKYEDVEIILQGGGELLHHVKQRVAEMKLKNVKIIDKILSRQDVAKLMSEADALLLPLRDFGRPYLGISSKLYEYQAVGKPIICCANGQPAEYVNETKSGIVVKPGDYKALVNAILYLKDNSEIAEKLGTSGRNYVVEKLSIESIGREMLNVFQQIVREV
ncbi:MAG: glycosyltransferase family 4 protein [archaeon YNP-LCB-003-016]|uniref:glycosyltransferase family 4 protein n=1 Tax=Candidatus Culexarchaeum yellowstonense TaxID=2928963 RepID=UPI0026F0C203|nr:glycosyltransferase family 4 protein [Candidatus Culexarchaeum yellowstonense]MCR6692193.1 glycosyltransferase family 4 protein [Candidatus Culexarchaeum yellowstonense]